MLPEAVSVTLALGQAPYQKTLPSSLLTAGMLRRMFDLGSCPTVWDARNGSLALVKRFPSVAFANRMAWAIWRRLPRRIRSQPPVAFGAWALDRRLSNWITPSSIFHGHAGLCLESLRTAHQKGILTLVENAACHPRHWKQAAIEECRLFGVDSQGSANFSAWLLRRMDMEFKCCDRIVVPSSVARDSFAEFGYAEKTVVVPTGVDADLFSPPVQLEPSPLFRACYVGRVELDKGVGRLLQVWKRLGLAHAELVLVGQVYPEIEAMLRANADASVRVVGFLPPDEVAGCYRQSNLLVLPSANEGLAQVILESMASGRVVVATDMSGAKECLTDGTEGLIVPARDTDALAEAILWCYGHRDEIHRMGRPARARIENEFTLNHYNQRIVALYRQLVHSH